MKKIAVTTLAAGAVAAGLALAPLASAQTQPIPEGLYRMTITTTDGRVIVQQDQIAYCGPDCFSLYIPGESGAPVEYRYDPATGKWVDYQGRWTVDGVNFAGDRSGATAVLAHV